MRKEERNPLTSTFERRPVAPGRPPPGLRACVDPNPRGEREEDKRGKEGERNREE